MKFSERVKDTATRKIDILQINVGKKCNLSCTHCHVMANPNRDEMMSIDVFDKCMKIYDKFSMSTIDITGGEPTMHKDIAYFIEESAKRTDNLILRTNLVGLDKREDFIKLLVDKKVNIVASMPCYTQENVDAMRGSGTFNKIVDTIKVLNKFGYGKDLKLDLVYNPLGAFLPPSQSDLEIDYKNELDKLGLEFNNLLTITNIPIGCFKNQIEETGELEEYKTLLEDNFNEATLDNLMCRYQLSISYDGKVYDCDFNQMEEVECSSYKNVGDVLGLEKLDREIVFKDYCYGCTAGAGSSCGGSLDE